MKENLEKLLKRSYSPYSKVRVAAIVETKDGKLFSGVNVENAAYPSGICAERNALFSSITNGVKRKEIKNLHLLSTSEYLTPCGACLQVMNELMKPQDEIIIYGKKGIKIYKLKDLIPYGPTKKDF